MQRLVYALDLRDDPQLIAEYEAWHRADRIWPSILQSLRAAGLCELQIFRTGTRLVLIIEATEQFSADQKEQADGGNQAVRAWEQLMWKYQQALPWAHPGQKWVPMHRIFCLSDMPNTRNDAGT